MPPRVRSLLFFVVAVFAIILLWLSLGRPSGPGPSAAPATPTGTPPPSPFMPTLVPSPTPAVVAEAVTSPTPERTPQVEVGELMSCLRDYRAAFVVNPVGNNAEITRALLGENPRKAAFIDRKDFKLNDQGELIDHWDHPYFFHAITGKFMEVRSAGPDGVLFTADDIVGE